MNASKRERNGLKKIIKRVAERWVKVHVYHASCQASYFKSNFIMLSTINFLEISQLLLETV